MSEPRKGRGLRSLPTELGIVRGQDDIVAVADQAQYRDLVILSREWLPPFQKTVRNRDVPIDTPGRFVPPQ